MTAERPTRPIDVSTLIPEYTSRFPKEMSILKIGGVYPGEKPDILVNPYTRKAETEYFGNIGEHCIAVAQCAEILANELVGKDHPQTRSIITRALVHDATKRFEIMRQAAVEDGILHNAYSESAYATIKPLLEEEGVSEEISDYMVHAGEETGHISLASFVELKDEKPVLKTEDNLAEMIIHLADDMTFTPIVKEGEKAKTFFLTTHERMQASDFQTRYPFLYNEGFGFDSRGNIIYVKGLPKDFPGLIHVKTFADWQVWVAAQMSDYLISLLELPEPVDNSEEYLKQLVNNALPLETRNS